MSVAAFSMKSGDRISHKSYSSKYSSQTQHIHLPGLSRLQNKGKPVKKPKKFKA